MMEHGKACEGYVPLAAPGDSKHVINKNANKIRRK
jgi:hypothetical protein